MGITPYEPLRRERSLRRIWRNYQWPVILILFVTSIFLGYVGFSKYSMTSGDDLSRLDKLYQVVQLATLESGSVTGSISWELELARWLLPFLTTYAAILAVMTVFHSQLQVLRLRFVKSHVIVCGLGSKGTLLAQRFRHLDQTVVAIEKNPTNPQVDNCRDQGVIVLIGNATEEALLKRAGVNRAKFLVAVCGQDEVNVEIAAKSREMNTSRRSGALTCSVHLVNRQLYALLREEEFGFEMYPTFRIEIFNIYERGARILLQNYSPQAVDHRSIERTSNLMVIGLGNLGESLVVETARLWYGQAKGTNRQIRIHIGDQYAVSKSETLTRRYPQMETICDLIPWQVVFENHLNGDLGLVLDQCETRDLDLIYICLKDHSIGLQLALALRRRLGHARTPIIVRMPENSGLATLLDRESKSISSTRNIHPFGLVQRTCTPNLVLGGTHEVLSQAVHENYLRKRIEEGMLIGQKRSMVPWEDLPEDLRASNRRQVDMIRSKLHAAGYGIEPLTDWEALSLTLPRDKIELMAMHEHEHWMRERLRDHWTYAPGDEDPKRKRHPDLLPWDELPEHVKDKDRQTVVDLPGLLARAGFQITPLRSKD